MANVRVHQSTNQRPVDRFQEERGLLRPLPVTAFDTDEVVSVVVSSHARVRFDGNRYFVPPQTARKTLLLRASDTLVRVLEQGQEVARHARCYDRGQLLCEPTHQLEALKLRQRMRANQVEEAFDALGEDARKFHLELRRRRQELPSPTEVRPQRPELVEDIDLEEPDPGFYDRLCDAGQAPEEPTHE